EVPAAPSVRVFAREIGVDLEKVDGTGPGNRITTDDVKAYAREKLSSSDYGVPKAEELPDFSHWGEVEKESISKVREITASGTLKSWNTIPHVTHFEKAEIGKLEEFRQNHKNKVEEKGGKLTVTSILTKLAAIALSKFPKFNASLDIKNKEIIYKKYYHIGIAVDTEKGLLVPVIKDVDKKNITDLAVEISEISEKARDNKLSPDDMQGGNFTISNLGGIGGKNFTPIVYHPQVAILGMSKAEIEPVYMTNDFKPKQVMPLSLSYDHRIIDGAEAARFMKFIKEAIENPFNILLETE
ncbi:MAG: 2-oxo acid dehydrogenase subunit E2, partial [Candidatus Cyclobacteriaceae bacterium M2_1C_046]